MCLICICMIISQPYQDVSLNYIGYCSSSLTSLEAFTVLVCHTHVRLPCKTSDNRELTNSINVSRFFTVTIYITNCKPCNASKGSFPKCGVFCQINILMDSERLPGSCNHKSNSKQTNNKEESEPLKHTCFPFPGLHREEVESCGALS